MYAHNGALCGLHILSFSALFVYTCTPDSSSQVTFIIARRTAHYCTQAMQHLLPSQKARQLIVMRSHLVFVCMYVCMHVSISSTVKLEHLYCAIATDTAACNAARNYSFHQKS